MDKIPPKTKNSDKVFFMTEDHLRFSMDRRPSKDLQWIEDYLEVFCG